MTHTLRVRLSRRGAEAVESWIAVAAAKAAVYHPDLPTVGPGPLVRPSEQVVTEADQGQSSDWYDPDLEFAGVDASVAQSTSPLLLPESGDSGVCSGADVTASVPLHDLAGKPATCGFRAEGGGGLEGPALSWAASPGRLSLWNRAATSSLIVQAGVACRRSMWQPPGHLSTALSASRLRMLAAC